MTDMTWRKLGQFPAFLLEWPRALLGAAGILIARRLDKD